MTTVIFYQNDSGDYIGFEADGHAGFSNKGKDIVCASVSVLLINLVNSLDELTDAQIKFESEENSGHMKLLVEDNNDEKVQLLFESSRLGLLGVQENYTKYLKLTNRRYKP